MKKPNKNLKCLSHSKQTFMGEILLVRCRLPRRHKGLHIGVVVDYKTGTKDVAKWDVGTINHR